MGRRRQGGVDLPEHVHRVKSRGRLYFYYQEGRGAKAPGERFALPPDPQSPEFWDAYRRLSGVVETPVPGSIAELVAAFRAGEDFKGLPDSTQRTYGVHLGRFAARDFWGRMPARDLRPRNVMTFRDLLADTPVMANQMLTVGELLWSWAIPLELIEWKTQAPINPFAVVKPLHIAERGHIPWPAWARDFVDQHAPEDLRRFCWLGRVTGQRESDLIRLGPQHRDGAGVWCRPEKTRRKRKAFRIPVTTTEVIELDRLAETPVVFSSSRNAPVARHRTDLYLYTPRGAAYTTTSLRARWNRWLATEAGEALCLRWREWVAEQVTRFSWEIDPEDVRAPTLHGLRGTAVVLRLTRGESVDQISNDIGMSRQMVARYARFRDQVEVAEAGQARLRLVPPEG